MQNDEIIQLGFTKKNLLRLISNKYTWLNVHVPNDKSLNTYVLPLMKLIYLLKYLGITSCSNHKNWSESKL